LTSPTTPSTESSNTTTESETKKLLQSHTINSKQQEQPSEMMAVGSITKDTELHVDKDAVAKIQKAQQFNEDNQNIGNSTNEEENLELNTVKKKITATNKENIETTSKMAKMTEKSQRKHLTKKTTRKAKHKKEKKKEKDIDELMTGVLVDADQIEVQEKFFPNYNSHLLTSKTYTTTDSSGQKTNVTEKHYKLDDQMWFLYSGYFRIGFCVFICLFFLEFLYFRRELGERNGHVAIPLQQVLLMGNDGVPRTQMCFAV